jgi:hypothetical protein
MTARGTRREFLKAGGALVVGFGLGDVAFAQAPAARGTVAGPPEAKQIDTWLAIHADNTATVYVGFAELGQGGSSRHQRHSQSGRDVLERIDRAGRTTGATGGIGGQARAPQHGLDSFECSR